MNVGRGRRPDAPREEPMKSLTAIPVFNEERHVEAVLREVRRYSPGIVVIDDGSTDRTPQLLARQPGLAARLGLRVKEVGVPRLYLDPDRAFGGVLDDPSRRLAYYRGVLEAAAAAAYPPAAAAPTPCSLGPCFPKGTCR